MLHLLSQDIHLFLQKLLSSDLQIVFHIYIHQPVAKKIALNFSSSVVPSFDVSVSTTLSVFFKLRRMCFPPASIKFYSQELNLSK